MRTENKEKLKLKVLHILNLYPEIAEEILVELLREQDCPYSDICGEKYLEQYEPIEFL